jgi:hypothetical protein
LAGCRIYGRHGRHVLIDLLAALAYSEQVLQLECFPDWKHSTDVFEAGHRYLNGPEAFLHALLAEYRDARKRYEEIYKRITHLVTPPLGFIFDETLRDQRLFEDRSFTWIRRYFYAHQTVSFHTTTARAETKIM